MCGVLMPSTPNHHPHGARLPAKQTEDTMDVSAIFERFELDPQYGFVTDIQKRANQVLPTEFSPWEQMVADLPALTATGRIRLLVDAVLWKMQ